MVTSPDVIGRKSALGASDPARRRERLFFGGMTVALTVVVFAGFAPTYYLNGYIRAPFPLTPLLHVHAVVFSAWMLLLVTQTSLIAAHRTDLHRRLGVAGIGVAALVTGLGYVVAVSRAREGVLGAAAGVPPLEFLPIPLGTVVVFPLLVLAAVHFRRRTDFHKRLMLLATVELVTAAIARLPVISGLGPPGFFGAADLFVVAMVVYDLRTQKRIHPATLWGGLFLIVSQPLRVVIGGTPAWQSFAVWLTG